MTRMDKILLLPAKTPACPKYGDILYGGKWLDRFIVLGELIDQHIFRLAWINTARWWALKELGIVTGTGKLPEVAYTCPWTGNIYSWWYPIGILVNGDDIYSKHVPGVTCDFLQHIVSSGGNMDSTDIDLPALEESAEGIVSAMMGHGYTPGTLPCDGSGDRRWAIVKMSNDDELLVSCWVWHNK